MNLVERLTGAHIPKDYLEATVVPIVWRKLSQAPASRDAVHAHLALSASLPSCSAKTVMELAHEYSQILLDVESLFSPLFREKKKKKKKKERERENRLEKRL